MSYDSRSGLAQLAGRPVADTGQQDAVDTAPVDRDGDDLSGLAGRLGTVEGGTRIDLEGGEDVGTGTHLHPAADLRCRQRDDAPGAGEEAAGDSDRQRHAALRRT